MKMINRSTGHDYCKHSDNHTSKSNAGGPLTVKFSAHLSVPGLFSSGIQDPAVCPSFLST